MVNGKNVLITGASSGIGEDMAYVYAKNGANVFITARRENLLKQVLKVCTFSSKFANNTKLGAVSKQNSPFFLGGRWVEL